MQINFLGTPLSKLVNWKQQDQSVKNTTAGNTKTAKQGDRKKSLRTKARQRRERERGTRSFRDARGGTQYFKEHKGCAQQSAIALPCQASDWAPPNPRSQLQRQQPYQCQPQNAPEHTLTHVNTMLRVCSPIEQNATPNAAIIDLSRNVSDKLR